MNNFIYVFFSFIETLGINKSLFPLNEWKLIYTDKKSLFIYAIDKNIFNVKLFEQLGLKYFNNIEYLSNHIISLMNKHSYYIFYLKDCNQLIQKLNRDNKIKTLLNG